jgi:hypothetical protein
MLKVNIAVAFKFFSFACPFSLCETQELNSYFFPFGSMASHVGFKDGKKVRVIPSRTLILHRK